MTNALDRENHEYNRRSAEAAESTLDELTAIRVALERIATVLTDIRDQR
ncbi:MAG TPA: hypothetical protein VIT65_23215 [Microlunatus sp.]